jgi:hypothetical protein
MVTLIGALVIAGAAWFIGQAARDEIRDQARRGRALQIMAMFAPAIESARTDPRALLVWAPLARAARQLLPDEFAMIDRATGATFPFSPDAIQAAHAQWSADWLAWERSHDAEYKRRAAEVEHELSASGGSPVLRAKLDAVEREKLELYQRRYEEYVRTAKALQALTI